MITFAGASSENINKYLQYTSDNKSNISNNNQKLGIQFNAEFPFNVNTVLTRTTQNNKKELIGRLSVLGVAKRVRVGGYYFTIKNFRQGIPPFKSFRSRTFKGLLKWIMA